MTRFLVGRSLILLSTLCSFSVLASTELSINTLVGIKDAPKVGEKFRIDAAAGYNAAPVTLVCMEKSAYSPLSGCELNANARGLYLDIDERNFTGRNVSGELIEFTGIKHGHLFFRLISDLN